MDEINVQEIENQQPLELAQGQGSQMDQLLASEATLAAQNLQSVQEAAGGIESQIQNLLIESGQESAFRSQLEQQQGLPQQQQRLRELSNLANMETARLAQQLMQTEAGAIGTMESRNFLNAQEARARRESAINTLTLTAEAAIVQGNIETATALIDRAVQARFEPIKRELEIQMFNLNRLDKRFLEPAMKRDAEARERQISTQIRQLEQQQQLVQNLSIQAAQYGAGAEALNQLAEAKNFDQAISIAGEYIGRPFQMQVQAMQFSQSMERARLALAREQFDFQKQSALDQAQKQMAEMNIKAADEFRKTQAFKDFDGVYSRVAVSLDRRMEEVGGTTDRANFDYRNASKNDAFVFEVVNSLARTINPDITRAADAGDATAETRLIDQFNQIKRRLTVGNVISPQKLQEAIQAIDTNVSGGFDRFAFAADDVSRRLGVETEQLPQPMTTGLQMSAEQQQTQILNQFTQEVNTVGGGILLNIYNELLR